MTTGLRSGEVADAAGVNLQTLRYYERRGILAEPSRSLGGHRMYPPETITLLRVIKAAQRLGFTLDEVSDLLGAAANTSHRTNDGLNARAREKLADVEQKIIDLQLIRDTLNETIQAGCDDLAMCAESSCCPIPFTGITHHDEGDTLECLPTLTIHAQGDVCCRKD